MESYTWRDYVMLFAGIALVSAAFTITGDAYEIYQKTFFDESATSGEDWTTYTNTYYGYEINYPSEVEFTKISDRATLKTDTVTKNQVVFIGDSEGAVVYNMTVGALTTNYLATSTEILRAEFTSNEIPELINGIGKQLTLKEEDFEITENVYPNKPSLEFTSPIGYMLVVANAQGNIYSVSVPDYTGATTTPKEQLTWEIIQTFKVLE